MEQITIEMKIKALDNVLKKHKLSNEIKQAIKTDFINSLKN
jgi:hypothetical protein